MIRTSNRVPSGWDLTSMKTVLSKRELVHYNLACVMLHSRILCAQSHPTTPNDRAKAQVMYDKLVKILWTRAPDEDMDVTIKYEYVPGNYHGELSRYKQIFERRPHQNGVVNYQGKVVLLDAPYKVRTQQEHDLLEHTIKEIETNHLDALVYYLQKQWVGLWNAALVKLNAPFKP